MAKFLVWNDNDPNDSFEVEADNADEATAEALDTLGWCVSADPIEEDEDDAEGTEN